MVRLHVEVVFVGFRVVWVSWVWVDGEGGRVGWVGSGQACHMFGLGHFVIDLDFRDGWDLEDSVVMQEARFSGAGWIGLRL